MILRLSLAILALTFTACSSSDEQEGSNENEAKELLIEPSASSIAVGEYVDFMVTYGGEDITSEAAIYYQDEKSVRLEEPRYQITDRIEYTFYAVYNNQISEKITVEGALDLILEPSASPVLVGDDSSVEFVVWADGEDVTSSSEIYHRLSGEKVSAAELIGSSFIMDTKGEHLFFATYNEISSPDVAIYAVSQLIDKVADANPDKYDSFLHRALAIFGTSTECYYCPYMIKAVDDAFEQNNDIAEGLILAAAHATLGSSPTDPMMCDSGMKVIEALGIDYYGYPSLNFNMLTDTNYTLSVPLSPADSDGKVTSIINSISSTYSSLVATDAKSAISASSILSDDKATIALRADVKVGSDSELCIGAWILEDGISADQYNAEAFASHDFSTHDNVLCATYPSPNSSSLFMSLGGVDKHEAGQDYIFYCEFTLEEYDTIQDLDNCHIVVFTYDAANSSIDNAITVAIGGSTAVEYK